MQVAAIPFRLATFLRHPQNAQQPFYATFLPEAAALQQDLPAAVVQPPQLLAAPSEAVVAAAVAEAVRSALGEGISSSTPLLQAGLDSLGKHDMACCQRTTQPHFLAYITLAVPAHLYSAL